MRRQYLFHMLGIAAFHFVAFSTFMTISGQFGRIGVAIPLNLTLLVTVNLIGAAVIFARSRLI